MSEESTREQIRELQQIAKDSAIRVSVLEGRFKDLEKLAKELFAEINKIIDVMPKWQEELRVKQEELEKEFKELKA